MILRYPYYRLELRFRYRTTITSQRIHQSNHTILNEERAIMPQLLCLASFPHTMSESLLVFKYLTTRFCRQTFDRSHKLLGDGSTGEDEGLDARVLL